MELLFLIQLLAVLLSCRIISTTVHELGHALPALLYSDEPVSIYVGSYGDRNKSRVFEWGRLTAFFQMNITQWNLGVCSHGSVSKMYQEFLVILGGPFASLIFGLGLILMIQLNDFSDNTIALVAFFIVSAIWDFLVNIFPNPKPVKLEDGRTIMNDGTQLTRLWKTSQYPDTYFSGLEKTRTANYEGAIEDFNQALRIGMPGREIYRSLAQAYLLQKDYGGVLKTFAEMTKHYPKFLPEEMIQVGLAYAEKGDYSEAIKYYSRGLYLNFQDPVTLNNRGSAYLQSGEYEKAVQDLELAIAYNPSYAEAYSNLGYALVKLRQMEVGFDILQKSLKLNPANPSVFLHLGFYYEKKGMYAEALEHFQKAKALGLDHHGIDFYIEDQKWRSENQKRDRL